MIQLTDRIRNLLKEAFEKRGGVSRNLDFFRKKRPTIYLWLNGKTKNVDYYVFITMMRFVEPFLTNEDRAELVPLVKIAKMAMVLDPIKDESEKSDADQIFGVIKSIWDELTRVDKEELLGIALRMKARNMQIKRDAEMSEAECDYLKSKHENKN